MRGNGKPTANIMQRVYDAMPAWSAPEHQLLAVTELSTTLHFGEKTIREALRRLRRWRCVRSAHVDGVWRYGQRKGSARPDDVRWRHAQ